MVFAHSSYWNDDDGRYKTHFQKIIELDTGEQIWVYVKDETGVYQRYIYVTQESYNAPANDTDVLKPGVGKNLTLFTCTPIGGVEGRWVVKAKYLDEAIVEIQSKLMFEDVSQKYRQKIAQIMRSLEALPEEERRDMYLKIYSRILTLLPKYEDSEKLTRVLQFLQLQIARKLISE